MVTSIVLSQTRLVLGLDEFVRLTATVLPENAANKTVTWSSSNPDAVPVRNGRVDAFDYGEVVITCEATDGSGIAAGCTVIVTDLCIDLGLPSGTLWATMNVGASSPEEYGDYFAWGETDGYDSGKNTFDWSTYKWCEGYENGMTKYCTSYSYGDVDNKTELDPEDDAAFVNWGSAWRMPSEAQFRELIDSTYTTIEGTTQNGVKGQKITSRTNGKSIFLPAAGNRDTSFIGLGSWGSYWSRTLYHGNSNIAWNLDINGSRAVMVNLPHRYLGVSVRPVRNQ